MISLLLSKHGTPPLGGESPDQLYGWLVAYKGHIHWGDGPQWTGGFHSDWSRCDSELPEESLLSAYKWILRSHAAWLPRRGKKVEYEWQRPESTDIRFGMKPPVDQSLDTDSGGWFTLLEVNFIVFETSASCLMLIGNHSSFTRVERWSEVKMRTPSLQQLSLGPWPHCLQQYRKHFNSIRVRIRERIWVTYFRFLLSYIKH